VKSIPGDWNSDRNTLTQTSTNQNWFLDGKCFRRAIQVELSFRLRKKLVEEQQLKIKFLQLLFKIEFPVRQKTLKISFQAISRDITDADEQIHAAFKRMRE
jgi:hypothetical protein